LLVLVTETASLSPVMTLAAAVNGGSNKAHCGVNLSAKPLPASPDVVSITASYNGMVSARAWQQVDLGLMGSCRSALQGDD